MGLCDGHWYSAVESSEVLSFGSCFEALLHGHWALAFSSETITWASALCLLSPLFLALGLRLSVADLSRVGFHVADLSRIGFQGPLFHVCVMQKVAPVLCSLSSFH